MRHKYYIKQVIIIIVVLIIFCQFQLWMITAKLWLDKNITDFEPWGMHVLQLVKMGVNFICGMLIGTILCENLKLDINNKGTVLMTFVLLVPSFGVFIMFSNLYREYLYISFFYPIFSKLPPYCQILLGAWVVFLIKAKINKWRRKEK